MLLRINQGHERSLAQTGYKIRRCLSIPDELEEAIQFIRARKTDISGDHIQIQGYIENRGSNQKDQWETLDEQHVTTISKMSEKAFEEWVLLVEKKIKRVLHQPAPFTKNKDSD